MPSVFETFEKQKILVYVIGPFGSVSIIGKSARWRESLRENVGLLGSFAVGFQSLKLCRRSADVAERRFSRHAWLSLAVCVASSLDGDASSLQRPAGPCRLSGGLSASRQMVAVTFSPSAFRQAFRRGLRGWSAGGGSRRRRAYRLETHSARRAPAVAVVIGKSRPVSSFFPRGIECPPLVLTPPDSLSWSGAV